MILMQTVLETLRIRLFIYLTILFAFFGCGSDGDSENKQLQDTETAVEDTTNPENTIYVDYTLKEDEFLAVSAYDGLLQSINSQSDAPLILLITGEIQTDGGGRAVLAADGAFTYEPEPDYFGTDQFNFTAADENEIEFQGTAHIIITPVNDPPAPGNDTLSAPVSHPVVIDVLENDLDVDGDPLTLICVGSIYAGSVEIQADETLLYTPPANYSGSVAFSYTVADGNGEQADAWVYLNVISDRNSIRVEPDTLSMEEDTTITPLVSELLENDQSFLEETLTLVNIGDAQIGTVSYNGGDRLTYEPAPDYFGTDTFTYTVRSTGGETASTTVTITILPVNDPPTINSIPDQTISANGGDLLIPLTLSDIDTALENLRVRIVASDTDLIPHDGIIIAGQGRNRTLRILPAGNVGIAEISITIDDGQSTTSHTFSINCI